MIYTVTLNPALDRTVWIDELVEDDVNRVKKEEHYAGGKGIDVSRVLTNLETPNKALGFIGGYTGLEIEGILLNEGINIDFTHISDETRRNIVINTIQSNKQYLISSPGHKVQPQELSKFFHKIENINDAKFFTFNGSLPPNLHPVIYAKGIEIAKSKGAKTFLDTDGENLRVGIQGKPNYIKPNIHELSRLVKRELNSFEEIIKAAEEINKRGVEVVLVSMGAKGILLVSSLNIYHGIPPKVQVKNTIGAGDSSIAGFIYGLYHHKPLNECLKLAVAAGTATTLKEGTALATMEDIQKIIDKVEIKEI